MDKVFEALRNRQGIEAIKALRRVFADEGYRIPLRRAKELIESLEIDAETVPVSCSVCGTTVAVTVDGASGTVYCGRCERFGIGRAVFPDGVAVSQPPARPA